MIKCDEILSCERINVTSNIPGLIEFNLWTDIFDVSFKTVMVKISAPKIHEEIVLADGVVKVFEKDGKEIVAPSSWRLSSEVEKTLSIFIGDQTRVDEGPIPQRQDGVNEAIDRIEKNLDEAADFIAKTLFFYIKGLSVDDIDRAKLSLYSKITERTIHYRDITHKHDRRKQRERDQAE